MQAAVLGELDSGQWRVVVSPEDTTDHMSQCLSVSVWEENISVFSSSCSSGELSPAWSTGQLGVPGQPGGERTGQSRLQTTLSLTAHSETHRERLAE